MSLDAVRTGPVLRAAAIAAAALAGAIPQSAQSAVCSDQSWLAGTVDLCAGTLVYRDYVYDDFGAADGLPIADPALVPLITAELSTLPQGDAYGLLPPDGAERYPSGEDNTADLVFLRVALDGNTVNVTFELNTLFAPGTTLAAIAIDHTSGVGGGDWRGLTVRDGLFPLPAVLLRSDDWDEIHVFSVGVPGTNTISGSFPKPPGSTWRVQAVTARADGRVMNVAFRGPDETGFWWERNQAQTLGTGDISAFGQTVQVADLETGATQPADPPPGAVRQRVYTSQFPVAPGEGIDHDGVPGPGFTTSNGGQFYSQAFNFLGKYQPYGFYEPDQPGPHGVQLMLHGLGENHSARVFFPGLNHAITDDIGETHNRLLVAPLGRGWKNWWSNYGERDALDALDDAIASYPIDPEKVHVSGYSMGGYGTYRIGSLNPDRFASAIVWVGAAGEFFAGVPFFASFSGTGAEGNVLLLLKNFRHIPTAMIYSGEDELVPVPTAIAVRDAFATLGYQSIHYLHPTAEHLTYVLTDDWTKESNYTTGRTLVANPARVTFRTPPFSWAPVLGVVQDHAYWISALLPGDDQEFIDVEGHSYGCAHVEPAASTQAGAGVGPAALTWVSQEVVLGAGATHDASQCFELDLVNAESLSVDLPGACLGPATPAWRITTDGPATVNLSNGATIALAAAGSFASGPPLAVSPAQAIVRVGKQKQFTAAVSCLASTDVVWSVQELDGGTIDANGLYTAPLVLNPSRTAHVIATSVTDGGIQAIATVELRQNAGLR